MVLPTNPLHCACGARGTILHHTRTATTTLCEECDSGRVKRWTDEDDALAVRLTARGCPRRVIAQVLGRSPGAIGLRVFRLTEQAREARLRALEAA